MRGYSYILAEMKDLGHHSQSWTETTVEVNECQLSVETYVLFFSGGSEEDEQENQPQELQ